MASVRRIWVFADAHIGHVVDGRDGAEWLRLSIADLRRHVGPVDYAINLGDLGHDHTEEQLRLYDEIRAAGQQEPWFHVVGNHDFAALRTGLWDRYIRGPRHWTLTDGNLAFFSLPAERGNAAGLLIPPVEAWLRKAIAAAQVDRNIVLAAHSFPYDTVERSTLAPRCLYPRPAVEKFLRDLRIDLWLGGHIHSTARTPAYAVRKNETTFINAASTSHVYHAQFCVSFILEIGAGSRQMLARCRDHDHERFLEDLQVTVPLAFPFEPGAGPPVQTPVQLDIPPAYSRIDEEQVERF